MRRTIAEESILLTSVVKWIVLASCTGVIVGLAASGFLLLLSWAINVAGRHQYIFLLMPVAFFLSSVLTIYLAPDAEGHGTEKVIEAIHKYASKIPIAVVPVKLVATIVTLAIGGSAGKEGPCAQIGAGLSSLFAGFLKFEEKDRRKLVICGISAGFAAVFGMPIAGGIFGVEVLFVGSILYDVLLPSFISAVTAYQISSSFGITYFRPFPIIIPTIKEMFLIKVIIAAIIFGIVSVFLSEGMRAGHKFSSRMHAWAPMKGFFGGAVIIILTLIFGKQYLGLGLENIESRLDGQNVSWYVPFVKIIFTSVTLNYGGSGGIITPIFFIGSATGAIIASVLHMDSGTLSAIGLVSLLAGAANTPLAASIMAVEMFGSSIGPYAAVACIVSYLISGHRSVYPSQILAIKKSLSLNVQIGKEMHDVRASFHPRRKTIISVLISLWRKAREKWRERGQ